jgi:hypothetical protein
MKKSIETEVKKRTKAEARKKVQMDKAEINDQGKEVLDETPLFHDAGFKAPPTMNERIRQTILQVQADTAAKLAAQNMTQEEMARILDEEDDFSIPEDTDNILTQYEAQGLLSELEEEASLVVPVEEVVSGDKDTQTNPPPAEQTATEEVASESA